MSGGSAIADVKAAEEFLETLAKLTGEEDYLPEPVAYPGILLGGGSSTNSVEDKERGSGGGSLWGR